MNNKITTPRCEECIYFNEDICYRMEGVCTKSANLEYTRSHRVCHLLPSDNDRRNAKIKNHKTSLDMNKETYAKQVVSLLEEQGRTRKWLAEQMGIKPNTLYKKLRDDVFSPIQIKFIDSLLKS